MTIDLARAPLTSETPTAPLPPAAVEALSRLECAFASRSVADVLAHEAGSYVRVTPEVQRAVTVYEVASERYRELTNLGRQMTGAEFDSLALAQDRIRDARATLATAGQLHLIEGGE